MTKRRVVVVGGGISGLTAAHALAPTCDVTLLEASPRLGGNIVTVDTAGFTLDGGPDSWVNTKPAAAELARSLGLAGEMIDTEAASRKVYVSQKGELLPMPDGLVLGIPTKFSPMITTPLFTWDGKLRMALEPFIPARQSDTDESIGDFFSRRLGEEVTDKLIAPMLGGIYAGDAWELSIQATFPQFIQSERTHGSLVKAMRAAKRPTVAGEKPKGAFTSLRGGMVVLVEALATELEPIAKLRLGKRVDAVGRSGDDGAWTVTLEGGERVLADDVVFAGPATALGHAARDLDPGLVVALDGIRYTTTATVFFALRKDDVAHPLDGVGYIVPRSERRSTMAATWVSSKWAHRAPEGHALIRSFFGGAGREHVVDLDDKELVALATRELEEMMRIRVRPVFTHVFRFRRASPQPTLGHLGRVRQVRDALTRWPGLHVTGSGFAIGIPDCIKLAQETARTVLARPLASA
jgi:protoporphyrinogen/coproporphyrinogen III oxidase